MALNISTLVDMLIDTVQRLRTAINQSSVGERESTKSPKYANINY